MGRNRFSAEQAIENADRGPPNPFLLNDIFKVHREVDMRGDRDLEARWVAVMSNLCRRCASPRETSDTAFEILESLFSRYEGDIGTRFYVVEALVLLKNKRALSVLIDVAKDPALLRQFDHFDDWIDALVDRLLISNREKEAFSALTALLGSDSEEMRRYASEKLLITNTPEAHRILVSESVRLSNELIVGLLVQGHDEKYCESGCGESDPDRAEALAELFGRVRIDNRCRIAPENLRALVEKAVRKAGAVCGQDEKGRAADIMEKFAPLRHHPDQPRPIPRRHTPSSARHMGRRAQLTLVNGGKNPELSR